MNYSKEGFSLENKHAGGVPTGIPTEPEFEMLIIGLRSEVEKLRDSVNLTSFFCNSLFPKIEEPEKDEPVSEVYSVIEKLRQIGSQLAKCNQRAERNNIHLRSLIGS